MHNASEHWIDDYYLITVLALCEDLSEDTYKCLTEFLNTGRLQGIDVTTDAIFNDEMAEAVVVSKSTGILSGVNVFRAVFKIVDDKVSIEFLKEDSQSIVPGDKICKIRGKISSILKAERTSLNFLAHLSGIATEANNLLKRIANVGITILDTRKTTPGMRKLEKEAVVHGGAQNHRFGLYDMVLIKDNHIDGAGSIKNAVKKVKEKYGNLYKIEVETRNIDEVKEALEQNVDRIMLDNMSRDEIKRAVDVIGGRVEIEVSGNMNEDRIKDLKGIGVNFVSLGYITSSAKPLDLSMIIE